MRPTKGWQRAHLCVLCCERVAGTCWCGSVPSAAGRTGGSDSCPSRPLNHPGRPGAGGARETPGEVWRSVDTAPVTMIRSQLQACTRTPSPPPPFELFYAIPPRPRKPVTLCRPRHMAGGSGPRQTPRWGPARLVRWNSRNGRGGPSGLSLITPSLSPGKGGARSRRVDRKACRTPTPRLTRCFRVVSEPFPHSFPTFSAALVADALTGPWSLETFGAVLSFIIFFVFLHMYTVRRQPFA